MKTYCLIVTNCTARKRGGEGSLHLGNEILGEDLATTALQWLEAIAAHQPKLPAREMYRGRSMVDAKFVADALGAPIYIASAGLGLVAGSDQVAPYDLTASGPRGGLQQALLRFDSTSRHWWELLTKGEGIAHLLLRHPSAILLAALPANYVEMVSQDLGQLPAETVQRLRLFTSQAGARKLPVNFSGIAMPYDDRLESIPNYAGTRADFPQRAMRHFVEVLAAHHLPQAQARVAVLDSLASSCVPTRVERQRADDETIKGLIRKQWDGADGRSTVLLRYLRDDALISCEQGRFAQLCREVRNERVLPKQAH